MESKTYDCFPASIILLSNALALAIYAIGARILAGFGWWLAALYVVYCLGIELRILKRSCVNCWYYGKWCGLGKGKICSLLFARGDPEKFAKDQISWWDVAPDFMVGLLPLLGGIILLTRGFSWTLVILMALLFLLSFAGNAIVRGHYLCKYCKQRELGCPAERLFGGARQSGGVS